MLIRNIPDCFFESVYKNYFIPLKLNSKDFDFARETALLKNTSTNLFPKLRFL